MEQILNIKDKVLSNVDMSPEIMIVSFRGEGNGQYIISSILDWLREEEITIDMVMQQSYEDENWSFSFSCESKDKEKIEKGRMFVEAQKSENTKVYVQEGLSDVSAYGVGMATASGVVDRILKALKRESIKTYHVTTSEISTTVTVDVENAIRAVIAISTEFDV